MGCWWNTSNLQWGSSTVHMHRRSRNVRDLRASFISEME